MKSIGSPKGRIAVCVEDEARPGMCCTVTVMITRDP